jgi:zinc D-Ala-D-Ala dipeptidase
MARIWNLLLVGVRMNWLIDCSKISVPIYNGLPAIQAPKALRTAVAIKECEEELVPVAGSLRVHPVYSWLGLRDSADAFVRVSVLERLQQASRELPPEFDLVVIDGHRTRKLQAQLLTYYRKFDLPSNACYVADPDDDSIVPPHTTGGAVDLTLGWRGAVLGLGTDFDDFSEMAAPAALESGGPSVARELRRLLSKVLSDQGMVPFYTEWWHWSYGDQYWADRKGAAVARYGEVDTM